MQPYDRITQKHAKRLANAATFTSLKIRINEVLTLNPTNV